MVKQLPPVEVTEHSDITPISREPIKKVNRNGWEECNTTELHSQLEALVLRKYAALNMSRADIAAKIQQGIDQLQNYILSRRQDFP